MSGDDYFIAVHGGAGYHHPDHDHRTKKALRACVACTKALQNLSLKTTSSSPSRKSLSLVEQAIISLEDDPYLNAGYGSNLCLDGTVECDAAIFAAADPGHTSSNGLFGSVGAVSGIKNPISAARSVLEYSQEQDKLGRVPPMTLVSQGAINFIQNNASENTIVPPENMISTTAKETWTKWKNRLEMSEANNVDIDEENLIQDTVGAVAWHSNDGFVLYAEVFSGGVLLKHPGRVGEAAIFGAGCWAKHYSGNLDGMSCSVSGTGEDIIRSNLARLIGETCTPDSDPHEILERVLVDHFWSEKLFTLILLG
ncbi:hypothetical protein AGABI2DRAFT_69525 [Agaricus bisporus var. bisporus H97]|uniref:hypothetical protein n=1 Tax=Agaricus bisporus var. bisporus (strain H97 / ATCC MYA-4626 / FGSC 10389) TaxID=936046 RepID=UPI00029F76AD|nr:hypothetical protein AGABI2DRAFT_69525 [Agaricus bisporus var. bisporus H97]EKV47159.1 hypothetical protein AGABI2DRAFT_69525 [Agaricus bisporus var. bisporus H97]